MNLRERNLRTKEIRLKEEEFKLKQNKQLLDYHSLLIKSESLISFFPLAGSVITLLVNWNTLNPIAFKIIVAMIVYFGILSVVSIRVLVESELDIKIAIKGKKDIRKKHYRNVVIFSFIGLLLAMIAIKYTDIMTLF